MCVRNILFSAGIKRFVSLIVVLSMLISFVCIGTTSATALSANEISAPSGILIEPETMKVLFEKNSHEVRACASITKVMTLVLVFEAIEAGVMSFDDVITTSAHAASMGGSDIWLEEGETMSVDDMIKAVVVASANDAAVALAEHISGSEDEFVNKMNEKAKSLGMNETVFKNCNGLDEEGHVTSAYDVAVMSAELIKHEKIFDYSSIWIDNLRGGETQLVNTNKLLKTYNGITGLKTGTTSQAGSCMSATAKRGGLSLVAVVLGCDTGTSRFADCAKLLDFGFANYKMETLSVPNECFEPIKVKGGMQNFIDTECVVLNNALLPKSATAEIQTEITLAQEIEAPVSTGTQVGKLTYLYDGATIDEFPITTKSDCEAMSFGAVYYLLLWKLFSL